MTTKILLFLGMLSFLAVAFAQDQWKGHILWAKGNNTTDPAQCNCIDQYVATEPACITGGGRACLIARAIDSAKANNYAYAFRLVLVSQCHNGGARSQLAAAGQTAIGDFLKTQ